MKISFEVIPYSNGIYSGLNIQIIPYDLQRNPNCHNSIVIDELAFSLIERLFLENENPWSHWGYTYLDTEKTIIVLKKLSNYKMYLSSKNYLNYKDDVKLLYKRDTKIFKKKFPKYKNEVLTMIDQLIAFLTKILEKDINGITVIGV